MNNFETNLILDSFLLGQNDNSADKKTSEDQLQNGIPADPQVNNETNSPRPNNIVGRGNLPRWDNPSFTGVEPSTSSKFNLDSINSIYHLDKCACPACNGAFREPGGSIGARWRRTSTTTSANTKPTSSLQTLANYLTTGYWQEAGTFTRKFNLSSSGIGAKNGTITYNITGWADDANGLSGDRQNLVREVFKLYSETLGINFQEVAGSGGDIRFTDNDSGAYAYLASGWYADSSRTSAIIDYSVVNIESNWYNGQSNYNSYTPQTAFHEVAHALGLGHQGQYNYNGTPLTYETSAQFANDSWQATMMSYWDQSENTSTGASFAWLQTPMTVDWLALNDIYSSQGFSTNSAFSGNTIYGVNTNISSSISDIWNQFSTYAGLTSYTIVDSDGYDTLDVSNFGSNQIINLAPTLKNSTSPSVSSIGGKTGNLSIAANTIIEAAKGGVGNDLFYGNNADNTFWGNGGNDSFYDGAGSDTYYGGAGTDWLYFNDSIEIFSYRVDGSSLVFSRISGTSEVDTVWSSIENLSFSNTIYSYDQLVEQASAPSIPSTSIISANNSLESGSSTNSTDIEFRGTISAPLSGNQVIAFYREGVQVGSTTTESLGGTTWRFNLQEEGGIQSITYTAQVVGGEQEKGAMSDSFELNIDTVAPLITIDVIETSDLTPLLQGTINDASAEISITIGGTTQTATNSGTGRWSLEWTTPLTAGQTYNVNAQARDAAGNIGNDTTNNELMILASVTDPNQVIWGTTASDNIIGGSGNDRLSGVLSTGTSATQMGRGQIDTLTGGLGLDTFVLGDNRGIFYDDRYSGNLGTNDYARIKDFRSGEDKIQLRSASYLYDVSNSGILLYWDRNSNSTLNTGGRNRDELIAVIEGVYSLGGNDITVV